MKFPQDFIDRVREANNIVDIIGQYVQLRKTGGNHQGLCPFHNEKSPSFSVSEDKQVYHCFGCKASGNVISFVSNYQGLSFPETVEYLARRAAIPLPQTDSDEGSSKRDLKTILQKVSGLAADFYHDQLLNLPAQHPVRDYLKQRGLTDDLVKSFKLGYAPDAWSNLAEFFSSKKVPQPAAEQLGLIKKRGAGKSGHYDLFRHRVMFPIYAPTGECIGFGGRVLSSDQQPKYLNSPDSPIFHKGRVFYGLNHSAKYIRSADEIIVVEGYMDWLALAKVSIDNVAATLGTALTNDHAKLIKRYTERVLLLFDGDDAGKAAARRSLPILLSEGLKARGLFLPDECDPDDYVAEFGAQKLKALIEGAPDLFDLVLNELWMAHQGSPTGKIQVLDEIAPILAATADQRLRVLYTRNVANLLDVESRLVEQSVRNVGSGSGNARPTANSSRVGSPQVKNAAALASEPVQFDLSKAPRVELELLNVILMKEVYLKEALESGVGEQMAHPGCKGVFQRIEQEYRQMPSKFDNLSALLTIEVKPAEAITRHLSSPYNSLSDEGASKLLQDCIKRVKENFLRSKSKELVSNLRGAGTTNPTDQLEQIMNIHKTRRSLTRES